MASIDPTARIAEGARLGNGVEIGPYCTVGPRVELADGVRLVAHVHVEGATTIGARTVVHPFASLGSPPQSLGYRGGDTTLQIGADCQIRESVTMNIGTEDGGGRTVVGDRGYFMAYAHIAHDSIVGNDVIFANNATLGGHTVVGDFVFMGGLSATHQFTHIGANAMIAGYTGVRGDVIPFAVASGPFARLTGINVVGMRRRKYGAESVRGARAALRALFSGEGSLDDRVATIERELGHEPAVAQVIAFVRGPRKRALCPPGKHGVED